MEKKLVLKAVVSNDNDKLIGQSTVYLVEETTDIILPISLDLSSAEAIMLALQNVSIPRPHTHDLIKRMLNCCNARLVDILIYDYSEDIYYSYIRLLHNGLIYEIDARPSDALALAARHQVPIYARSEVVDKYGVKLHRPSVEA